LILACTEVEAAWRGILTANDPAARGRDRLNTADYVRLLHPLRLADWSVALKDYPDIPSLRPFSTWNPQQPTGSLTWYDAYNQVKHDRERYISMANLGAVLEAMAAVFVLQCAQWGPLVFDRFAYDRKSCFYVEAVPMFPLAELYIPDVDNSGKEKPWIAQEAFV
jgi:hypothetical protein